MKKFISILILGLFLLSAKSFAADKVENYLHIYKDLAPAQFSYIHGIDPDQYYDMQTYAYTPYPLFRLNSTLYFKNMPIETGYYLLTPREHNGEWYILFKDNGKVKYYIPCYKREIVPIDFYETHLPKPKLTFSQKVHIKFIGWVGRVSKSSKRRFAPKTYLEVEELDNEFYSIVVYYGDYRYYMILKSNKD